MSIARWLLNLAYLVALLVASPVLLWRGVREGKYRSGWAAKLLGQVPRFSQGAAARHRAAASRPRVWLHAASVGEVALLGGVIDQLRRDHPHLEAVISTTTATGHALAAGRFGAERVFYCPFDFSWAVRRALVRIDPALIVLVELEIWPNLIAAAHWRGVPVAVVNGRLSESSYRGYRRIAPLVRRTFARLSLVAAQDATYAQRFADLGVIRSAITVTGSIKFDDAPHSREAPEVQRCAALAGRRPSHRVWIAGSTQRGEEAMVVEIYKRLVDQHPDLRLILVPRHAARFSEVVRMVEEEGFDCRRRSQLGDTAPQGPLALEEHRGEGASAESDVAGGLGRVNWPAETILLVDAMGQLRHWWGLAEIALVGGSFGDRGGQNMLEPAGYGAAVCFGPHTENFRDIVNHLVAANAARVVADAEALEQYVDECLRDPDAARAQGDRARRVIQNHRGATLRTLAAMRPLIPSPPLDQTLRSCA